MKTTFLPLFLTIFTHLSYSSQEKLDSDSLEQVKQTKLDRQLFNFIETQEPIDSLQELLNNGADVTALNWYGTTLLWALKHNHLTASELMIERGVDINVQNSYKTNALMLAVKKDLPTIVNKLLTKKAYRNRTGKGGQTALMIGASKGHLEVCKQLISSGAKINLTKSDETALTKASLRNHVAIVQLLIKADKYKGVRALIWAANKGYIDMVSLLLDQEVEVNGSNKFNTTALMESSFHGHYEIVQLLLAHGAKMNVKDNNGTTPLMHAASCDRYHTCALLLKNKAEVNVTDNYNNTPLSQAIRNKGSYKICKLLLDKGADPNLNKDTLTNAANNDCSKLELYNIVKLLAQNGAKINTRSTLFLTWPVEKMIKKLQSEGFKVVID